MTTSVTALHPCVSVSSSESLTPVEEKINFSCPLKRKRPPKIQIPNVLKEIVIDTQFKFGCSPVKNDSFYCFEDLGGVYAIKGKKKFMEDTHKIVSFMNDKNANKGFFGVYDGHGGRKAAEFVADNLHKNVVEMVDNCVGYVAMEEAVKAAYLKTDTDFLHQGVSSGACCVTVLIKGTEIIVSNLGDCRAVLCRNGVAEALTKDHRAEVSEERKRIEDKGGYVEFHKGAWRVHGILSVSRSIGDAHLKDWVVSEPDTRILNLTHNMDFIVLAPDGLWEQVGNQEAIDIVLESRVVKEKPELVIDDFDDKNTRVLKEKDHEYSCVSTSSSPKVKRVSVIKQKQKTILSPSCRKTESSSSTVKGGLFDVESENESPPSKLRRISLFPPMNMKPELVLDLDNKNTRLLKENDDKYAYASTSSSPKVKRVSVVKQKQKTILSPSCRKTEIHRSTVKGGYFEFENVNESPPTKLRRTSFFPATNMKTQSPRSEYNNRSVSEGLVNACKKLANLAVSRGSMDDITVMVIDLKHFRPKHVLLPAV